MSNLVKKCMCHHFLQKILNARTAAERVSESIGKMGIIIRNRVGVIKSRLQREQ